MKYRLIQIICIITLSVILLPGCRKKNRPPYTPYTPSGPNSGFYYTAYDFSSLAIDPEGDSVAIRFDWGNGDTSNWSPWVASEQALTMSNAWVNPETYFVRAQAKDKKENTSEWSLPHYLNIKKPENGDSVIANFWVLGGNQINNIAVNDVWYSTDGVNWTCASRSASWLPRSGHASVVFDNKMWVIGGFYGDSTRNGYPKNDVWFSSNGINWTCATESAQWSPRDGHSSVVFDNKIWVIGGREGGNDVWYSSDGINWICATLHAGWPGRRWHTSVVFDNKLWVLGGLVIGHELSDVWYSVDGINWTCATPSAEWPGRGAHTSVVYNNKIWVIGGLREAVGGPSYDVWFSPDGINWTCATDSAWPRREYHSSVIFDNKIWVMGGGQATGSNDVWYSSDGVNWTCATPSAEWSPRNQHTSVVFKIIAPK